MTIEDRLKAYEKGKWASAFAPRKAGERRYWLVKSEPESFSFDDLLSSPKKTARWDGVRNHAARNFLRDGMKIGDGVFFYHSMIDPQTIVGTCEIVKEGYPDPTDPHSDPDDPTWFAVDLRAVSGFARPVTLVEIKKQKELAAMALLRVGRLSVSPVTFKEWEKICSMAS